MAPPMRMVVRGAIRVSRDELRELATMTTDTQTRLRPRLVKRCGLTVPFALAAGLGAITAGLVATLPLTESEGQPMGRVGDLEAPAVE